MSSRNVLYSKKQQDNDDIWDDTELIKMYEEAVSMTENTKSSSTNSSQWKIGDNCVAPYYEDDLMYPAEIVHISGDTALVRYEGYGNEDEVPIAELMSMDDFKTEFEEEGVATETDECTSSGKSAVKSESETTSSASYQKPVQNIAVNPPMMGMFPPLAPPPPPTFMNLQQPDQVEALSSMLMSWYMSGYHTGCYVTQTQMKNQCNNCKCSKKSEPEK